jgi:hypothetical protein
MTHTGTRQRNIEATLAHAHGVAAYTTREWQQRSFARLARERYATMHEREAFVRGYLAAAANEHNKETTS